MAAVTTTTTPQLTEEQRDCLLALAEDLRHIDTDTTADDILAWDAKQLALISHLTANGIHLERELAAAIARAEVAEAELAQIVKTISASCK